MSPLKFKGQKKKKNLYTYTVGYSEQDPQKEQGKKTPNISFQEVVRESLHASCFNQMPSLCKFLC